MKIVEKIFVQEVRAYFDKLGFSYDDYLSGYYPRRFSIAGDWQYFREKYGDEYWELYDYTLDKIYKERLSL